MTTNYDVIIAGGGPAGIFAALELTQTTGLSILLIEKGHNIDGRQCPARDRDGRCATCTPCNLVCGLGGAGAFSDGKLTLSADVGGRLADYVGGDRVAELIKYVDDTYLRFGAPDKLYGAGEDVDRLCHQAALAGLRLKPVPIRHLGTEHCRSVLRSMRDCLDPHLDLRLDTAVNNIIVDNGRVTGIVTEGETNTPAIT